MANIDALADSTVRLRGEMSSHIGFPLLIKIAIQRSGIRHEPDIKRLAPQIRAKLVERGIMPKPKRPKRAQKPTLAEQLNASEREILAAKGFPRWFAIKRSQFKAQTGTELSVEYRKLTRWVFMYIEETYSLMSANERPAVDVVETLIRSNQAKKAAETHAAKKVRAEKAAAKAAKQGPEQLQLL